MGKPVCRHLNDGNPKSDCLKGRHAEVTYRMIEYHADVTVFVDHAVTDRIIVGVRFRSVRFVVISQLDSPFDLSKPDFQIYCLE